MTFRSADVPFTSKADIEATQTDVCFVPKADIRGAFSISDEQSGAGQDNPDFGELARLGIDLD
jgi:hypothetical protein